MSSQGRALISALNRGDHQSVDQFGALSDQDIKIVNHHVHELFERAIRTENFKLFLALIKIPRVKVSGNAYCAMRHATRMGLVEYVSQLARVKSANPNLQDKQGNSALIYAVAGKWSQKKALDLVRAISMSGTLKANLRGVNLKTPLHFAMEKEWYEVAEALVDAGAHPNVEDDDGKTPLFMALTGDVPTSLFQKMLAYDGDPPEEVADTIEEDAPSMDPDAAAPSALPKAQPVNIPLANRKATGTPDDTPRIKSVDTQVDLVSSSEPSTKQAAPRPKPVADTADFATIMEGQELDDSLSKHFLFSAAADDPRMRMHRSAVVEKLPEIQRALSASGHTLQAEDARKVDPASGKSLWHVVAESGQFSDLLTSLLENKAWPAPQDFAQEDGHGRSIATILEENSTLQSVLNQPVWNENPRLLTSLLGGIEPGRRAAFGQLIARANLMLLHTK